MLDQRVTKDVKPKKKKVKTKEPLFFFFLSLKANIAGSQQRYFVFDATFSYYDN